MDTAAERSSSSNGQAGKITSEEERKIEQARAAAQIRDILEIDKDVTRCLEAAGQAVKSLTGQQNAAHADSNEDASDEADADDDDEEENKEDSEALRRSKKLFKKHTNNYYTLVQSIADRLRRQIYALEEADIIAPNQTSMQQQVAPPAPQARATAMPKNTGARTGTTAATMQGQRVEQPMEITNGGLGNFDIGWLNSRGDQVGMHKEAELWAMARAHLEKMQGGGLTDGADDMDVDEVGKNESEGG